MTLLFSMPGGSEWILIIISFGFLLTMPVLAIVYYSKYKEQKRQVKQLTEEKNDLLNRLLKDK